MRTRAFSFVNSVRAIALGVVIHAWPFAGLSSDPVVDRQRAVEAGLLPEVVVEGEPVPGYALRARMEHYNVPGLGIAVIHNGRVDWAEGYGVKESGGTDAVAASTLFQAASISKPVAATAVLRLVGEGRLNLDSDVNDRLRSWQVPENRHTSERPVTLRDILTHTAGLSVHGFPGYASGEPVPTAVGVLEGTGNTEPVRVNTAPGRRFRYSGGGYVVAQVLVQDVTGKSFASVMKRFVLDPLGMHRSTYLQPLPERLANDAAVGHRSDGTPVRGRWHTYPEQAAAGLWTTPADLARFALGIAAAYQGNPGSILDRETAREMLSERVGGWGLGLRVAGTGADLQLSHEGANAGYRAYLVLYPITGSGVAVMTNSDSGYPLLMELVRSVSRVYEWPDYQPEARPVVQVDPATLSAYAGEYILAPGYVLTIKREDGRLFAKGIGQRPVPLLAESETEFFPEGRATRLRFVRSPEGRVTHLILQLGGRKMLAIRREP